MQSPLMQLLHAKAQRVCSKCTHRLVQHLVSSKVRAFAGTVQCVRLHACFQVPESAAKSQSESDRQSQAPTLIVLITPAGTIKLGEATTSYDADGGVSEALPWEHLTLDQLKQEVQRSFLGGLQQMPPMFSAIRVKGKRLYESAREGKVVERAARSVHVSQFDLTEDAEDKQKVHFYISCSKGTYIRSLAHDLVRP